MFTLQDVVDFRAESEKIVREEHSAKLLRAALDFAVEWAGYDFVIAELKKYVPYFEAAKRWKK